MKLGFFHYTFGGRTSLIDIFGDSHESPFAVEVCQVANQKFEVKNNLGFAWTNAVTLSPIFLYDMFLEVQVVDICL